MRYQKLATCALAFLVSCSSPFRVNMPALRFETPEVSSPDQSIRFDVGTQSFQRVTLTPDVSTVAIHTTPITVEQRYLNINEDDDLWDMFSSFSAFYLNLSYAPNISPPIEFSYRFPDRLGLKAQLFGPREAEAKKGDFSAALFASYASRNTSGSGSLLSEPDYTTYEFSRYLLDAAFILGIRTADSMLLYGGPFILHSPYSMRQNLDTTPELSNPIKGVLNSYGGNFGVRFDLGSSSALSIEGVYSKMTALNYEDTFVNGGFKFSFNF